MTKETYNKSVDKLLDAYNNDKLSHGTCSKCAVGNLLETAEWGKDFLTPVDNKQRDYRINCPPPSHYEQFDILYKEKGFTRKELMRIEETFEDSIKNTKEGYDYYIEDKNEKRGQYIGLSAVLKIMETMVDSPVECRQQELNNIAIEKYHLQIA